MSLPFSLKIGHVALEISSSESIDAKSWLEISRSWNAIKDLANKYIENYESVYCVDPFQRNPKVKLMSLIFDALKDPLIEKKTFIDELLKTGKFSEEEAKSYIEAAVIHGMIKKIKDQYYTTEG